MDSRQRADLDRHITGNYGEDSVPDSAVSAEEIVAAKIIDKYTSLDAQDDDYWDALDDITSLLKSIPSSDEDEGGGP